MAWIGVLDQETLTVKPVAWDGEVHGFFDAAPLALTAVGVGKQGLAGQACRRQEGSDLRTMPRTTR